MGLYEICNQYPESELCITEINRIRLDRKHTRAHAHTHKRARMHLRAHTRTQIYPEEQKETSIANWGCLSCVCRPFVFNPYFLFCAMAMPPPAVSGSTGYPGPPSPPVNCTVRNVTSTSISVHCEPGTQPSSPLRETYLADAYVAGKFKARVISREPSFEIGDLEPGSAVNLFVHAANEKGTSTALVLALSTLVSTETELTGRAIVLVFSLLFVRSMYHTNISGIPSIAN